MSPTLLGVILAPIIITMVIVGIAERIKHDAEYAAKLNDWPRRKNRDMGGRDTHAKARQDGDFVDGMITGVALDELDNMFK